MRTKKIILGLTIILSLASLSFIVLNSSGIAGKTGSPGETTCSQCHSGGTGTTTVLIGSVPEFTTNQFVPGQSYQITVYVSNTNYTKFGFGCEILDQATSTNTGTMNISGPNVQFITASNGRKNAVHTAPYSAPSGAAAFTFYWTAPNTTNNIVIYAAGNAVNGNGTTIGDAVGTTSLLLTPSTSSIKENNANNSMLIFPNPASDFISIHIDYFNSPTIATIELSDLKGSQYFTLLNTKLNYGQNEIKTFLPTELSNGIYLLKVRNNKQIIASQIVLIKK